MGVQGTNAYLWGTKMASLGSGITNKQAKYLAALCRELRIPYDGRGMTRDEASTAISVRVHKAERLREERRKRFER